MQLHKICRSPEKAWRKYEYYGMRINALRHEVIYGYE
jgi:hypothetical protein